MSDWQVERQTQTKRLLVRHSVPPFADTVKDFFGDKVTEAEHLRSLVAHGIWDDPKDIRELTVRVIPSLFVQNATRPLAIKKFSFVSDVGVITSAMATIEGDVLVSHTVFHKDSVCEIRRAWDNSTDHVLCPVSTPSDTTQLTLPSWYDDEIEKDLVANETKWVGTAGQLLLNEEVVAAQFAVDWSVSVLARASVQFNVWKSLFYAIYTRKMLSQALDVIDGVHVAIFDLESELLLGYSQMVPGSNYLYSYDAFTSFREQYSPIQNYPTQAADIVNDTTSLVAFLRPVNLLSTLQQGPTVTDSKWRLLVVVPQPFPRNSSFALEIALRKVTQFFASQYNFVSIIQQAISSGLLQSPDNTVELEQLILPKMRAHPELFAVLHVLLPRVFESPIQLILNHPIGSMIESRTYTMNGTYSFTREYVFARERLLEGSLMLTPSYERVAELQPSDTYEEAMCNSCEYYWASILKNSINPVYTETPGSVAFILDHVVSGLLTFALKARWPLRESCTTNIRPISYIAVTYSLEEVLDALKGMLRDIPGSVAAVVRNDGVIIASSTWSVRFNVAARIWNIDVFRGLHQGILNEMISKLGQPCTDEGGPHDICWDGEVKGYTVILTDENGDERKIDLSPVFSFDAVSLYLVTYFPSESLTSFTAEEKVGFGLAVFLAFVFFVVTVGYSLSVIHSIVTLKRLVRAVASGSPDSFHVEGMKLSTNTEIRDMQESVLKIRQAMIDYTAFVADPVVVEALAAPEDAVPAPENGDARTEGFRNVLNLDIPADVEMQSIPPSAEIAARYSRKTFEERLTAKENQLINLKAVCMRCTIVRSGQLLERIGPNAFNVLHTKVAEIFARQVAAVGGTVAEITMGGMTAMWSADRITGSTMVRVRACVAAATISQIFNEESVAWFSKRMLVPFQILLTLVTGDATMGSLGSSDMLSFVMCGPVVQVIEPQLRQIGENLLNAFHSTQALQGLRQESILAHATPSLVIADDATAEPSQGNFIIFPVFVRQDNGQETTGPHCICGLASNVSLGSSVKNYLRCVTAVMERKFDVASGIVKNLDPQLPALFTHRLITAITKADPQVLRAQKREIII